MIEIFILALIDPDLFIPQRRPNEIIAVPDDNATCGSLHSLTSAAISDQTFTGNQQISMQRMLPSSKHSLPFLKRHTDYLQPYAAEQ